jgi:hypothetical protein
MTPALLDKMSVVFEITIVVCMCLGSHMLPRIMLVD